MLYDRSQLPELRKRAAKIIDAMPDREITKLDIFAELLCGGSDEANAMTPRQAGPAMGHDCDYGSSSLQKLRKSLGEQAR